MTHHTYGLTESQGVKNFTLGAHFIFPWIHTWLSSAQKEYICTWGYVYLHNPPPSFNKSDQENHPQTTKAILLSHQMRYSLLLRHAIIFRYTSWCKIMYNYYKLFIASIDVDNQAWYMVKSKCKLLTCKHCVICHWFSLTESLNILINIVLFPHKKQEDRRRSF